MIDLAGIDCQQERWPEFCEEIKSLALDAYDQMSAFREKVLLDVDYERYAQMDARGVLFCVTARDDEKLIGYNIDIITAHPDFRTILMACPRAYWIIPEYRAKAARKLFSTVERLEKEAGIDLRQYQAKKGDQAVPFFEALGYVTTEVVGIKWLSSGAPLNGHAYQRHNERLI